MDGTGWQRDADEFIWRGRAMASDVTVWVADGPETGARRAGTAVAGAEALFREVERQCTRFDVASDLMRCNARPGEWVDVPDLCYRALAAAQRAWRLTGGRFDPRVLTALTGLGYDRSLAFDGGDVRVPERGGAGVAAGGPAEAAGGPAEAAGLATVAAGGAGAAVDGAVDGAGAAGSAPGAVPEPGPFLGRRPRARQVRLPDRPLDLGGIGKGLALRWAAQALGAASANFLINAGGDCVCRGQGPEGDIWRLAVEDPCGDPRPVAVLAVRDRAVCTSSTRRRRWRVGGRQAHHLIDPRSGSPAVGGLSAVTVVGADPAWSEVWSKALFVEGRAGIADLALSRRLAALWVAEDGSVEWSAELRPHLLWVGAAQEIRA